MTSNWTEVCAKCTVLKCTQICFRNTPTPVKMKIVTVEIGPPSQLGGQRCCTYIITNDHNDHHDNNNDNDNYSTKQQHWMSFCWPFGNLFKHNLYWKTEIGSKGAWYLSFIKKSSISHVAEKLPHLCLDPFAASKLDRWVPRNTTFLHRTSQFLLPYPLFQILLFKLCSSMVSCVAKIRDGCGEAAAVRRHR